MISMSNGLLKSIEQEQRSRSARLQRLAEFSDLTERAIDGGEERRGIATRLSSAMRRLVAGRPRLARREALS
jgi:hypothetical protein